MQESKSCALPLGDSPLHFVFLCVIIPVAPLMSVLCFVVELAERNLRLFHVHKMKRRQKMSGCLNSTSHPISSISPAIYICKHFFALFLNYFSEINLYAAIPPTALNTAFFTRYATALPFTIPASEK